MKAIVNIAPGKVEFLELPTPEPGKGQVRIRTAACGICATDIVMINGWQRTGFPAVPGHEWAGTVDAVGPEVDPALTGMPCVAENVLQDGGEVGFEHPGGYGEFLLTEARNLQILPRNLELTEAVLIEPLAVCVRGWNRLRLTDRHLVLVCGDGPIGLLLVMLLKLHGTKKVILVGGRPARLQLAMKLGADSVLNYHQCQGSLTAAVLDAAAGEAVRASIEASGSAAAMDACLQATAPGGKVLVLGDYGSASACFPWNHLLHRELELIGSNASAEAWPEAAGLAATRKISLKPLISHILPAAEFATGLELAKHNREALKVVLDWKSGL